MSLDAVKPDGIILRFKLFCDFEFLLTSLCNAFYLKVYLLSGFVRLVEPSDSSDKLGIKQ